MKVGLALYCDRPALELAELAATAEEAGFAEIWWADHYNGRELATVLTLSAVHTSHIRIGTGVTSVLLRHPAVLASLFATLAEVSEGRVIAGLGPGGWEVAAELNVTTSSPLGATREAASILRQLLAGQVVEATEGRAFPVPRAALRFVPPEPVPIYLAGRGPRMLELAGELADGVITHGLAPSYLNLVRERRQVGALRTGRAANSCEIAVWIEVAIGERQEAIAALRPRSLLTVGGGYDEGLIPIYGLDPEHVLEVRKAVRAGNPAAAAALITDQMVEAFNLGGPTSWMVERLQQLEQLGVDSVMLSLGEGAKVSEIEDLGRGLKEVIS
jgi:5,10-methylenetetrahydromethanopterin reductase